MALDADTFTLEAGSIRWRLHSADHLGQFDIAVPANDDLDPDATALTAADAVWQARDKAPLPARQRAHSAS